jgi:hypothetical protein
VTYLRELRYSRQAKIEVVKKYAGEALKALYPASGHFRTPSEFALMTFWYPPDYLAQREAVSTLVDSPNHHLGQAEQSRVDQSRDGQRPRRRGVI